MRWIQRMLRRFGRKVRNWSESPFSDQISESWLKNESSHLIRKSRTPQAPRAAPQGKRTAPNSRINYDHTLIVLRPRSTTGPAG
jgi:hypothetical protein